MVESFGEALRRRRESAGMSQPQLARLVPISQASLSRYERGLQAVDPAIADRLDEILNAGGALRVLLHADATSVLTPDDRDRIAYSIAHPSRVDGAAVSALADVLAATRRLEDATSAAAVLPMVRQQLAAVRGLLAQARSKVRPAAAALASDCSQFLGWLLMATGSRGPAVAHFDAAISYGIEANDSTLVSHGLSFKGYAALLAGHPGTTASLSTASRRDTRVYAPLRAYDAYQETLALIMEADHRGALRTLGEANDLAAGAAEDTSVAPSGMYWYTPSFLQAQHGIVLFRLGRHAQAVELLTSGLAEMPPELRDAEWTGEYREALDAARSAD